MTTYDENIDNIPANQRILITGGTGLLGSALKEILHDNADRQMSFVGRAHCDLIDERSTSKLFAEIDPTMVIHLAGKVGGLFDNMNDNFAFFEKNMRINLNVLSCCKRGECVRKVVSCLSTCVFPADAAMPLAVDNMHHGHPHWSNIGYAYAKRMLDVSNRMLHAKNKPFVGIVPTNMFGPHDNFDLDKGHVIPALIHKCYLAKQTRSDFVVKGDGTPRRQFLYSKDAAKLILLIMSEYDDDVPLILAPDEEWTIHEVVKKIVLLMNFQGNVVYQDLITGDAARNNGQSSKFADGSIVKKLFPSFEYTDFDVALKETVDWFLNRRRDNEQVTGK